MDTSRSRMRMMHGVALAPVLGGVVLLAGCSVSPFNALSDDQRIELRDGTSAYQQEILADLFVDEVEYRQAMDDWHGCVSASGADPSDVVTDGNQLGFDYTIEAPTDADQAAIQTSANACLPEYFDAIGRVWASQDTKLS